MAETSADAQTASRGDALDLQRGLTFFTEDPDWVPKMVVGSFFAVLSVFFLVGAVFMMGYAMRLARLRLAGQPGLPEWDALPEMFLDGAKGTALYLGHALPLIVVVLFLALALGGGTFLASDGTVAPEFQLFVLLGLAAGFLIFFLVMSVVLLYVPAAFVRLIQTDQLGEAFDPMDNLHFIRENTSGYLLALLILLAAVFITPIGFAFFCIGIFPAVFWSHCVMGHSLGELARISRPLPDDPASGA